MSDEMDEQDAMRSFCDALKKSASCAREMASVLNNKSWVKTAEMLDGMRESGVQLSRMKAMTRMEVLQGINMKIGKTH